MGQLLRKSIAVEAYGKNSIFKKFRYYKREQYSMDSFECLEATSRLNLSEGAEPRFFELSLEIP